MPKTPLHSTNVSRCCGHDRAVRVPQHVETDRGNARSLARRVKHSSAEVRLIDSVSIVGGEDQGIASRLSVAEAQRLEFTSELRRDRHAARTALTLRLLLAVNQT